MPCAIMERLKQDMELVYQVESSALLDAYGRDALVKKLTEHNKALYSDFLTGACNRRYLDEQVAPLDADGVMMIDVDNYKSVNDTYGHQ